MKKEFIVLRLSMKRSSSLSAEIDLSQSLSLSLSARCSKFGTKKSCYLQPADLEVENQGGTMLGPVDALCSPRVGRKPPPLLREEVAEIPVPSSEKISKNILPYFKGNEWGQSQTSTSPKVVTA
jgi:hypothetical protein